MTCQGFSAPLRPPLLPSSSHYLLGNVHLRSQMSETSNNPKNSMANHYALARLHKRMYYWVQVLVANSNSSKSCYFVTNSVSWSLIDYLGSVFSICIVSETRMFVTGGFSTLQLFVFITNYTGRIVIGKCPPNKLLLKLF